MTLKDEKISDVNGGAKEDFIEQHDGIVETRSRTGICMVRLDIGKWTLAVESEELRIRHMRALPGSRVRVEINPYVEDKVRIIEIFGR